jgi:hypothetical protein
MESWAGAEPQLVGPALAAWIVKIDDEHQLLESVDGSFVRGGTEESVPSYKARH